MLREILDPLMEASRPSMLKRLTFKQLDFGSNPFVVRNIKYVGKKGSDMATSIDIDFAWAGKSNIVLAAKTHIGADINIAVKDLEIYSNLRVTMNPLVPLPSPIGGLVISMTQRPVVEFHVELPTGLEWLYNAIDKWLEEFVSDLLGDMFIQPERLIVPLSFSTYRGLGSHTRALLHRIPAAARADLWLSWSRILVNYIYDALSRVHYADLRRGPVEPLQEEGADPPMSPSPSQDAPVVSPPQPAGPSRRKRAARASRKQHM